jgi:MFS superfamily sulfate permease-like transporter
VSFADTSVLSRTFAVRGGYHVDPDQELVALGVANAVGGFFQGFPVSASSSRTPVAVAAGARTQLACVVGAAMIVFVLVFTPGLFRNLPTATLAAVVIAAAMSLVEVDAVVALLRARPGEFVISVVAFLGIAVLGVLPGLGVAVVLSLLAFVRRAWMPHSAELVRVDALKGYHDAGRHPEGRRVPGLVLFRFDAPLFFANADVFKERVLELLESSRPPARWLVVTAEPITDVDATAAAMLAELHRDLAERGVTLAFAELKGRVREQLARVAVVDLVRRERFFPTVGEAVRAYVTSEGVEWLDWEDRAPPTA